MYSELLQRCYVGDQIAHRQLFLHCFLYQLVDRCQKQLQLEPRLGILPSNTHDHRNFQAGIQFAEQQFLKVICTRPHFLRELIEPALQASALQQMQQVITQVKEDIDREIDQLDT